MISRATGSAAIAAGTTGIAIAIFFLAGNSSPLVQIGVMISGAIVLGSGVIAIAIADRRA